MLDKRSCPQNLTCIQAVVSEKPDDGRLCNDSSSDDKVKQS